MKKAILLISCPDQKGIVASVSQFLFQKGWNIVDADQHSDLQTHTFFMRIEWEVDETGACREEIAKTFVHIAQRFEMQWELSFTDVRPRVALFVSRHLHCLYDLLYRHQVGQLPCKIPLIISNHGDAAALAQTFGIRYAKIPITPDTKQEQEARQLALLREENIDLIVLARYHQILTQAFVEAYPNRIINIHHSFLPAFVGKSPYAQAHKKGVKIIGATSHYVTPALDEGPIIEQDTVRVSHRDSLEDLIRKGEDLERVVLSRAVRWHLQRKILCYANKTVVFE